METKLPKFLKEIEAISEGRKMWSLIYCMEINCIAPSYFNFESVLHKNKEGRRTDKDLATNNCQKLSTPVENSCFLLNIAINTVLYSFHLVSQRASLPLMLSLNYIRTRRKVD